ncbi:hypothetical protein OF829_05915 [Sphingomonas sp. LB-2]|uniref:hypothetical protein n=1 Tax=Sphingomonas caeni TaxID=2984949 RepID=UPI0022310E94|nr:hypothetical protein [Sphingomonas caeni]MCW3846768.1 hypothetical protein [Sphingomonas caeni]
MSLRARFAPRMEIRMFENRVRVTNLETHQAIDREAGTPFSSDTMLVADAAALAELLRAVIIDLEGSRRWFVVPSAVIHPVAGRSLGPGERLALAEMAKALGFRQVAIGVTPAA